MKVGSKYFQRNITLLERRGTHLRPLPNPWPLLLLQMCPCRELHCHGKAMVQGDQACITERLTWSIHWTNTYYASATSWPSQGSIFSPNLLTWFSLWSDNRDKGDTELCKLCTVQEHPTQEVSRNRNPAHNPLAKPGTHGATPSLRYQKAFSSQAEALCRPYDIWSDVNRLSHPLPTLSLTDEVRMDESLNLLLPQSPLL